MSKVIAQDKLTAWLDFINHTYELWVPQDQGSGICLLAPYSREVGFSFKTKPQLSAKGIVFPQTETLLKYSYNKDESNPEDVRVSVESVNPQSKRVVWGVPPCDVAGISFLEKVFAGQGYQDPYFKGRRDNCIIVALSCNRPDNSCFCTSVGGSPVEAPGADLIMTRVNDDYVVEVLTPKGAELIDDSLFAEFAEEGRLKDAKQSACDRLEPSSALRPTPEMADELLRKFEDPYWKNGTDTCLSCGICTYICPTCYCFNITDESEGNCGERLRCWDSCMFPMYSLEASGHNPRQAKFQRFRNRINHKFSYLITNCDAIGCTGCGRCIKECPVGMDIRYIVALLLGKGC